MSLINKVLSVANDAVGTVVNIGQELLVDPVKVAAGAISHNDVARDNAIEDIPKHGTIGFKYLNKVLRNPAMDEVISKIPFGEDLREPVTSAIDKFTEWSDKEMLRKGMIEEGETVLPKSSILGSYFDQLSKKADTQAVDKEADKPKRAAAKTAQLCA